MSIAGMSAGHWALFVTAAGLVGILVGTLAEVLIARFLPRLGGLPITRARMTTAALTGCLCAALASRIGLDWSLPAFLVLGALSVQLARIDLAHHLLPNPLVSALTAAGFTLLTIGSAATSDWEPLLRGAAGAVILFMVYLVLALVSPAGIGMGDVKLAAPVGLYLGYLGWGTLFYGGALGFVFGALASLALLALKRIGRKNEVAFGPSMLAAALTVVLAT